VLGVFMRDWAAFWDVFWFSIGSLGCTHTIYTDILHGVPKASVRGRLDCLRHAERFQSGLLLKSSRPLVLELSDVPMRQTYCYMLRPHNAANALE